MKDDSIAELRAIAEQLVAIGDHVKNQWRASEWQRTQCLDNAPLVAQALLLALDEVESLSEAANLNNKYFKRQLAALAKEKADAN